MQQRRNGLVRTHRKWLGIYLLAWLVGSVPNLMSAESESASDSASDSASEPGVMRPDRIEVYKTVGDVELKMHLFGVSEKSGAAKSAIVFFFGGGWNGGKPSQFFPHCRYLAERGMVAMAAEYRVASRHQTSPFECVKDGKSAVRWVRENASRLGVDPLRVAAGGGSAGGHVAAACATVEGLDEDADRSVRCLPDALVLFNPVFDNGPNGFGYDRVGDRYLEISPFHNIREGMAPAIVFFGTEDHLVPVATAESFKRRMFEVGSRSDLSLFEGQGHGFFNFGRNENRYFDQTVSQMDRFLVSLGFLKQE